LGSKVSEASKVGDRVTALPLNSCQDCDACGSGLFWLCSKAAFTGTSLLVQGACVQFIGSRAGMLQRLPDGVSFVEGVLVAPLAVGH